MEQVTLADDQKKLRMLQVALRVTDHLFVSVREDDSVDEEKVFAELLSRWIHLKEDLTVAEHVRKLHSELGPLAGQPIFDSIRRKLKETSYDYKGRISRLNDLGFETARKCVDTWGGRKAKDRFQDLKPLSVHCETRGNDQTELYYDRSADGKILINPGHPKELLRDCLSLEFSFFHEYLSHSFPKWSSDDDRLSEGWLLALELEWFKEEYTFLDRQVLLDTWLPRLGMEKREFWVAEWLFGRCEDKVCPKRFLLEWVANWNSNDSDLNDDLVSLIIGAMKKAGSKLGGVQSAKKAVLRQALDDQLCPPCTRSSWKIKGMREILEIEMDRFDGPKTL